MPTIVIDSNFFFKYAKQISAVSTAFSSNIAVVGVENSQYGIKLLAGKSGYTVNECRQYVLYRRWTKTAS